MSSPTQQLAFTPEASSPTPELNSSLPDLKLVQRDRLDSAFVGVLPINRLRITKAADLILRHLRQERAGRKTMRVFGVNAQIATLAQKDRRFAAAMLSADVLYPDGISIVIASRVLGHPLKERVPGGELMELLCREAAVGGLSVYFLGGLPGAAEKAARILQERYPLLKIAGVACPPVGFEQNAEESARVLTAIQEAAPDILFVGLGVPKQELWVWENTAKLPVGVAFPIGAALDTTAGLRKRAPLWAQKTGIEWLYRLAMEPKRLWRRYLIGNTRFVWIILRQRVSKKRRTRGIYNSLNQQ